MIPGGIPDWLDTTWVASTLSAVFFVVDPIAVVPLFIAMTAGDPPEKRAHAARGATLIAALVLCAFALCGRFIFAALGLTLPAFQIAGGILLLLTAIDQLQTREPQTRTSGAEIAEAVRKDDITVVPLAMPLLAGPGAIATVMVLSADAEPWQLGALAASIVFTCSVAWALLRGAESVERALGTTLRAVLVRVTGLLLAAVGVQFVLSGLLAAFPALGR